MGNEQVKAPNYPLESSQISLDLTDGGIIQGSFMAAIIEHGNDAQLSWKSYDQSDNEYFTMRLYGASDLHHTETEGIQMCKWLLDFKLRKKTLLIDTGTMTVSRFEGEFLVSGSNEDISDVVGAYLNYKEFEKERLGQGWKPDLSIF